MLSITMRVVQSRPMPAERTGSLPWMRAMEKPFWGGVAGEGLLRGKSLDHCGLCPQFPCAMCACDGQAMPAMTSKDGWKPAVNGRSERVGSWISKRRRRRFF